MKTQLRPYSFVVVLAVSLFAAPAVFGQTLTFTWTNQNPAHLGGGGDMNAGVNWTNEFGNNGVPNPMVGPDLDGNFGDKILFDGVTTGPLSVTQSGGTLGGFGGQASPFGIRIVVTSNQISPVTIYSVLAVSGGLRMSYFSCEPGSGGLMLGDGSTNIFDIIGGEINGQISGFTNDSTVPAVVTESVRWRMGGAGAHPHVFTGSGDWLVRNHMRSANSSAILVQKFGPGTMTWIGTNIGDRTIHWFDQIGNPITIGEGTMIWKTSDLVGGFAGNPNIVHTATLFKYDANDGGTASVLGSIAGTGPIQVSAGTMALGGQNTISGNWTLSGGTVIAQSAEIPGVSGPLGQTGTISFGGGTLRYSVNNAFDYSPRFDTSAGQAISIDTAGQTVIYATALASSGGTLTKVGLGELILTNSSSYSGLTTINQGTLIFQGPKTGTANITVADGATLGVVDSGTQVTPNTLTLGTSAGANLEFDNVNSTTTAPLAPNSITSAGTTVISINGGSFNIGNSYPLVTWTGGSAPAVSLGIVDGAGGTLSTNGNTIQFNCVSVALIWSGSSSAIWNNIAQNWTSEGNPTNYLDPAQVVFNDTALGPTNVTLTGVLGPEALTVNNNTNSYSLASSSGNNLSGNVRFGKRGPGSLTLSGGANANTGVTTLRGGTVILSTLANGGSPSDIGAASSAAGNLVLNGGGLQYIGAAASIDRLFTVGNSGGSIDVEGTGPLTFNNPGVIPASGALTLNGNTLDTNVLASALIGGGSISKIGTGTWVLTGTNGHGGGVEVTSGVLQVGAGGSGSLGVGNVSIATGTAIDFQRTGTLTVPGAINGAGTVIQNGTGRVILANNNGYTGGTTINAGVLQVGNGGGSGSLFSTGPIVNNTTLDFNTSGSFLYGPGAAGIISGTGDVVVRGGGFIKAIGNNTYSGWTTIENNTIFQPHQGQDGLLATSVVTNSGILRLESQLTTFTYTGNIMARTNAGSAAGRVQIGANNVNIGLVTLTGTNTYTGGTFIGDNQLVLGDGLNPGRGSIVGNVQFVNNFTISQDNPRTLTFNRPDDFTFGGSITDVTSGQANRGVVQHSGAGMVTLTGNNTYGSGTVLNSGNLQVGNGGTGGTLGSGPVTLNTINTLIINRAGYLNIGSITGSGAVTKLGTGVVTLLGTNAYTGITTVSNGVLAVGSDGSSSTLGDVVLEGGSIAPGGLSAAIGSLTANNLTVNSGGVVVALNRANSPSNGVFNVLGTINYTTGTLKLLNYGPPLVVGDKFTIFNQPVTGGGGITVLSPGFAVQNDLAVDGSVTVTSIETPGSQAITVSVSGTNLNLTWPAAWKGLQLQAQFRTNTLGLSSSWISIIGSDAGTAFSTPISPRSNAFFRLVPQ